MATPMNPASINPTMISIAETMAFFAATPKMNPSIRRRTMSYYSCNAFGHKTQDSFQALPANSKDRVALFLCALIFSLVVNN